MENLIIEHEDLSRAKYFISKSLGLNPILTTYGQVYDWATDRSEETGESVSEVIKEWSTSCIERIELTERKLALLMYGEIGL